MFANRLKSTSGFAVSLIVVAIGAGTLSASPAFAQEAVFVVRHAEQKSEGSDPELSPRGKERAWHLAEYLSRVGLTGIYTSELKRARHTSDPIAQVTGLVQVVVKAQEYDKLVQMIRRDHPKGRVLVVGHSNTVPDILKHLGVVETITIADSEYDDFFVVTPRAGESPLLLHYRF